MTETSSEQIASSSTSLDTEPVDVAHTGQPGTSDAAAAGQLPPPKKRRDKTAKGGDHGTEQANSTNGKKKRRRVNTVLDKKYNCPHDGCTKSYSRAEHLYRHQLNRWSIPVVYAISVLTSFTDAPKQIYECDYPGCDRKFVRQDLRTRHKERHEAKKSGLVRTTKSKYDPEVSRLQPLPSESKDQSPKDTAGRRDSTLAPFISTTNASYDGSSNAQSLALVSPKPKEHNSPRAVSRPRTAHSGYVPVQHINASPHSPLIWHHKPSMSSVPAPITPSSVVNPNAAHSDVRSYDNTTLDRTSHYMPEVRFAIQPTQTYFPQPIIPPMMFPLEPSKPAHTFPPYSQIPDNKFPPHGQGFFSPSRPSSTFQPTSQHYPPLAAASAYPPSAPSSHMRRDSQRSSTIMSPPPMSAAQYAANVSGQHGFPHRAQELDTQPSISMPMFASEVHSHAPFTSTDDFTAWLFDDDFAFDTSPPATGINPHEPVFPQLSPMEFGARNELIPVDHSLPELQTSPPASYSSQSSSHLRESIITESRRHRLLDLVNKDFRNQQHAFVTETRSRVLRGNQNSPDHVLSMDMLQTYMTSFWLHVHQQMPILHRPTFSSETCPDLLLIAMLALGASNLDKSYPLETRELCSDLSFFLAWHTRFRTYQEVDFGPPAKLWIFQALLLLEIYEKLFSTRSMHERAHVHHATTLTLMRRGSSLVGRSPMDFPPFREDSTKSFPRPNASVNSGGPNKADEEWNVWTAAEATRRTAFAAFIIDTTHATMFGHSAVMVAHEMRITLPCHESMWSATSMDEVNKARQNLDVHDLKPVTFLEALKKTLNSQKVRTNTFGRVIIMAGLLSVSWHMKMQDVRVSSVGVGKQGSWGSQLLHAFDFWKSDFDGSLAKSQESFYHTGSHERKGKEHHHSAIDQDNVFESRTVLHHLAHMAMHCDVLDCQIFAGATRLLGRAITPQDQNAATRRMRDTWAPSARARDATFYALRFLSEVLIPEDHVSGTKSTSHQHRSTLANGFHYSARDDFLLNRPWVLYLATLVVWAYGYALDGPIAPPTYTLTSQEIKVHDMQGFLRRVGGVKSPEALGQIRARNSCLGLLMLLRDMFRDTRWELLHEASDRLGSCIELLMPGIDAVS